MVCQNCQSSDIVTIQGQNYCINCGNIVTSTPKIVDPPAKNLQEPIVAKTDVNALAKTKSSINPKPSTQLTPISLKVSQRATIKAPVKSTTSIAAPQSKPDSGLSSAKTSPKLSVVAVKTPESKNSVSGIDTRTKQQTRRAEPTVKPMPKLLQHPVAPARQMNDLRPSKTSASTITHKPSEPKTVSVPRAALVSSKEATTSPDQVVSHPPITDGVSSYRSLASACRVAWSRANSWRFLKFGLVTILSVALPLILLLLTGQSLTLSLTNVSITTLFGIGSFWLASYFIAVLAGNNVIYGSVKLSDNRTADPSHWRSAALASLWPVVGLDISIVFLVLLTVMSGIGLDSLMSLLNLSEFTGLVIQRVIIGLGIYTIFSLWLIRQIARCAIVTGSTRVFDAIGLAFFSWRKQTSLIITAGITAVSGFLLAALVDFLVIYGLSQGLSNFQYSLPDWVQVVAVLSLSWFLAGLAIVFNWSFWQAIYRQTTRRFAPAEQSRLVGGRIVERSHVWAKVFFLVTIVALLSFGSYLLLQGL